jgi:hypothetical protein
MFTSISEGRRVKQVFSGAGGTTGRGESLRKNGEEGKVWWLHFEFTYEIRAVKPGEIVKGGEIERWRGCGE